MSKTTKQSAPAGANFANMLAGLDDLTNLAPKPVAPSPAPAADEVRIEGGVMIRVDLIDPDPNQPRRNIDPDTIEELAKSIKARGQLQPINIRPNPNQAGRYLINWGERRWHAFKLNKAKEIRAEIKEHENVFLAQLAENIEREDLTHMEVAYGIQKLIQVEKYTQAMIVAELGKSQAWVSNYVQLPLMPDYLRGALEAGTILDVFTAVEAFRLHKQYPDKVTELVVGAAPDAPVDRSALRAMAAKYKGEDNRSKGGKASPAPAPAGDEGGRPHSSANTDGKPAPVSVTIFLQDVEGTELGALVLDHSTPPELARIKQGDGGAVLEVPLAETRVSRIIYH